jgi:sec-independent protein translocase protein TatA
MPGWISPWELAILLLFALLIFGPKKLPEMGRSMGKGMREFKESITGEGRDEPAQQAELPPAASASVASTTTIRDNDAL